MVAQQPKKAPSQANEYRRTIYLPPDDMLLLAEVARILTGAGVNGLIDMDDAPKLSTTIRAALRYIKDHPPQTRG